MNKFKELSNPLQNIDNDIYKKLVSYPLTFNEIIDCVLRTQNELNDAFNEEKNPYAWAHPINDSTEWGCLYEREFRRKANKLGIIEFIAGDHNTGEDLTCVSNPEYSIEFKTSQGTSFWNTNSRSRKCESTKYIDPNKKTFYILVKHSINEYGEMSANTKVSKIYFGMLSKNDWTNSTGAGAAYLHANVRNLQFIEIWNDIVGNTIDHYQSLLDNDYYDKMIEIEKII